MDLPIGLEVCEGIRLQVSFGLGRDIIVNQAHLTLNDFVVLLNVGSSHLVLNRIIPAVDEVDEISHIVDAISLKLLDSIQDVRFSVGICTI